MPQEELGRYDADHLASATYQTAEPSQTNEPGLKSRHPDVMQSSQAQRSFIRPYTRTHPCPATRCSAMAGPLDVVPVDDQRVLMTDRRVPVRMGVRFRPFPILMGVLVVLVMDMEVFVPEGHMDMLDLDRIPRRPEPDRQRRRRDGQNAQHRE